MRYTLAVTYSDLIEHFGTCANAARTLGESRQMVNRWKHRIPFEHQYRIQKITRGKLKAILPMKKAA